MVNCGKGGSGHKRMKKAGVTTSDRELLFKEHGQEYALISAMLGSNRCTCKLESNTLALGTIRGSMRRRQVNRINKDDIVLVGLREYQETKVDIIHVYTCDEVRLLLSYGELSPEFLGHKVDNASETLDEIDVIFMDI